MELKPLTQRKTPHYLAALTIAASAALLTGCNEPDQPPALGGDVATPVAGTVEIEPQLAGETSVEELPTEDDSAVEEVTLEGDVAMEAVALDGDVAIETACTEPDIGGIVPVTISTSETNGRLAETTRRTTVTSTSTTAIATTPTSELLPAGEPVIPPPNDDRLITMGVLPVPLETEPLRTEGVLPMPEEVELSGDVTMPITKDIP